MIAHIAAPTPISAAHVLTTFFSGEAVLDIWLRTKAIKNEGRASRTYVIAINQQVLAYYSLAVGSVVHSLSPGNLKRNMPDPIPVIILARLAVDISIQGKGIGKALVRDAILRSRHAANIAGIRAILVHALHQKAADFYCKCGFLPSPVDALTLMLRIEDIK